MAKMEAPYYPIIYVRGYAMTRGEIDETTADPFCGFNLGSTVYRAVSDPSRKPRKYVFESPIVRLMSEFGYSDVYEDGRDILDPEWETDAEGQPTRNRLGSRSIIIHRYYDNASGLFGTGTTPKIETFARELGDLIVKTRDLICSNPDNGVKPADFRCYLVAHSMGGLVCRAFLQNPALDPKQARKYVDKLFTYATPHNGIDVAGVNVPQWLSAFDMNNFDRDKRMPEYLDLKAAAKQHKRVDLIPEDRFPSRRVFCMVGTNRMDYTTAAGLSRTFVGHGSDGLVLIKNATLRGLNADGSIGAYCAKAFAYRAHSGFFGIVNSEEAFQNLARFLFGDVRVDVWLDVDDIRLPEPVQKAVDQGRQVDALYQVEALASPRGKLWYLTRRVSEEDSVSCFSQAEWKQQKSHYLSSVFLANRARVNPDRRSLSYGMTLGVRVPDYEIERKLWINEHYEGGYLFRNSLILDLTPPTQAGGKWKISYAWQDAGVAAAHTEIDARKISGEEVEIAIPFDSHTVAADGSRQPSVPGIRGKVRLRISAWQ
ncbi:esterase/lipase family protein [Pseudoxanthomonas sp.]|uniref:esterase/lipase family protein n=1 Tax=Pseudoxanthomonas sp. TaxID=1871049 RepID=UPI003F7EBB52